MFAEFTLTLKGPAYAFLASGLMLIIAGKLLQQGGVNYARGKRWEFETLIGAIILSAPFLATVAFVLASWLTTSP